MHTPRSETLRGISRDTKYYSEPSMFDPGRYLKQPPALDPREFVFGYGRRICPGIEFGFQAMWILAASILWAFEVTISEKDAAALQEDTKRFSFGMLRCAGFQPFAIIIERLTFFLGSKSSHDLQVPVCLEAGGH